MHGKSFFRGLNIETLSSSGKPTILPVRKTSILLDGVKRTEKKEECRKQVRNFYTRMPGTIMYRIQTRKKEQLASADAGIGAVPPECASNAGTVCYVMCLQFRVANI